MPVIDLGPVVGPQGPQGATGAAGARGEQGLPGPNQITNQTSTPLTGVIVGDGSVVGVRSIDATPTDGSTGIPTSGGVKAALDEKMPVMGMGKNLLDNWYFDGGGSQQEGQHFPINQRGLTTYSGAVHIVDRWMLTGGSASILSNGISVANAGIRQWVPASKIIDGATYTISALTEYGLKVGTGTLSSSVSGWQFSTDSINGWVAIGQYDSGRYDFRITGAQRNIAAKLELGPRQTLCHNEGTAENPVWVLNEVPDFQEELSKCQKYFFAFNAEGATYGTVGPAIAFSATQADCFMTLPSYMRKTLNSSLSYSGSWQLTDGINSGQRLAISSMSVVSSQFWTGSTIVISVTTSGMTPGKTYYLRTANDSTARLFISADL